MVKKNSTSGWTIVSMQYIHHVPGRLRVQTTRFKGDSDLAQASSDGAMRIDGVLAASANSHTGSLIILYDRERLGPATLWRELCERDLASGALPSANESGVVRAEFTAPSLAAERSILGVIAGIVLEKLLERSAVALVGALI